MPGSLSKFLEEANLEDADLWEPVEGSDEMGDAVAKAHKLENPLDRLTTLEQNVTLKTAQTGVIQHFRVQQLSTSLMKWIMDLMARNMKQMYKRSIGGWKPNAKKREMTEENSRYLIVFVEDKPVAFSHFQFDMDYGRQVLYCYETQVELNMRSVGLGKLIMETLEKIAKLASLPLVVLTVFKFNVSSLAFFKHLGYDTDQTCPSEDEKRDYVILSKKVL